MIKIMLINLMLLMSIHRETGMPMKQVAFEDITSRDSDYIAVEIVESRADGIRGGYDTNGYIAYNTYVPKGEKVISFMVYSPESQECDDILYVIDNGRIR